MIYILYYILSLLQSLHIITGGYILLQSIYTILSLLYYFYIIYVCIYIYINLLCVCCTLRLLRLAILYMSISKAQRTDVATPKSPAQGHLAESDRWWDRWSDRWYLGDLKNDHLSTTNWKTKISHCFFCCYPSFKLVSSIRMSIKWRVYQWEFQDPKMEVR